MIGRRALFSALGATGLLVTRHATAQTNSAARPFNGLISGVGDLSRLSRAQTRSISPENFTGAKGGGGQADRGHRRAGRARPRQGLEDLAVGRRSRPAQMFTLAEITGPGAIQHIWMTPTGHWRFSILRVYWDGETTPSIEVPVGDFFASGWGKYGQISSLRRRREPGQRVQLLLDDAVQEELPDHDDQHRRRRR